MAKKSDNGKKKDSGENSLFKEKIQPVMIEEEMQNAYLDYAMSVIIGRALPDVRDGLKPVHRRVLHAMNVRAWRSDRPYVKSAKIVGEVIGNYHPHGDMAVYDTLVRMVQVFSLRVPLIDGQGNFGSIDGDRPAAYRYTEARLTKIAEQLLRDIEKETVDFIPNFDNTNTEPVVLPASFPNLLVNGSTGIAVGMATNIPPHNLGETIDAVNLLIENPNSSVRELMKKLPSPDFPTGGIIMGKEGLKKAYETGKGSIILRAKHEIEELKKGKIAIIINEIPYQVNKANLITKIAYLVRNKLLDGISDLRDESDREGMRIVIELKRDTNIQILLNKLFKQTQLQISYSIMLLALVHGQPKIMGLAEILTHYLSHRYQIVLRRTKHDLRKAQNRAHILEGLKIALDNIDAVIKLIRSSPNVETARGKLMEAFKLSEIQANAILEMRLQKLTSLEVQKIIDELKEVEKLIKELRAILESDDLIYGLISDELIAIKDKYNSPRKTQIEITETTDFDVEDLIADEDMVLSISNDGFIRRLPVETYKKQNRGGKGVQGASTKRDDFVSLMAVASMHDFLILFSNKGKAFVLKTYEIPEASKTSRGKSLKSLINLAQDEKITAFTPFSRFDESSICLVTKKGILKKTDLTVFQNAKKGGIIGINLKKDDELISAKRIRKNADIVMASYLGNILRANVSKMRSQGRQAGGIIGMRLGPNDRIIGMEIVKSDHDLFVISQKGFGKRIKYSLFANKGRGGKGMIYLKIGEKNGPAVDIRSVQPSDDIIIMTQKGQSIRIAAKKVSSLGRSTMGVKIMNLKSGDLITDLAIIKETEIL